MLKKAFSGVLTTHCIDKSNGYPSSPCDVSKKYASVAELPAALLKDLFEHPKGGLIT